MTDQPSKQRLSLAQVASYPRPGMAGPAAIGFTPDSGALTWLWSESGGLVRSLWRVDLESGERRVLVGPDDGPDGLSGEEELRRERTRTRELGVTSYAWARDADPAVLLIPGGPRLRLIVGAGEPEELDGTENAGRTGAQSRRAARLIHPRRRPPRARPRERRSAAPDQRSRRRPYLRAGRLHRARRIRANARSLVEPRQPPHRARAGRRARRPRIPDCASGNGTAGSRAPPLSVRGGGQRAGAAGRNRRRRRRYRVARTAQRRRLSGASRLVAAARPHRRTAGRAMAQPRAESAAALRLDRRRPTRNADRRAARALDQHRR